MAAATDHNASLDSSPCSCASSLEPRKSDFAHLPQAQAQVRLGALGQEEEKEKAHALRRALRVGTLHRCRAARTGTAVYERRRVAPLPDLPPIPRSDVLTPVRVRAPPAGDSGHTPREDACASRPHSFLMDDEDETPENRVRFRSPLVSAKASSFGRIQTLIVAVVLRTTTLWIARRPLLLPKNFLLRVDFLMLKKQLELRGVIPPSAST